MNRHEVDSREQILREVTEVGQLPIVPKILELICKTTGMRFAALARVTSSKWVALAVLDKLDYGVVPGDELELLNTLCGEVRAYEKPVIIDSAKDDEEYKNNRIPKDFGFQSHISVPITRGDKSFYGTLCAVDPEPNDLKNEKTLSLFTFFADLISQHLETVDLLNASQDDLNKQLKISDTLEGVIHERTSDLKKNVRELARSNQELKDFSYIASHDLQEPLRKIQTYTSLIAQNDENQLSDKSKSHLLKVQDAVERMRRLINDLLAYSVVQTVPTDAEPVDLNAIFAEVEDVLSEEIQVRKATIKIAKLGTVQGYPFQLRQLFQNLIGNSLKYSLESRPPVIEINATQISGSEGIHGLDPNADYLKVTIKDNGIGFDQQDAKKIFEVFQRLHGKAEYSGTGIGLAIVRKIIENHHGFISVEGEKDRGATFAVFLPTG